MQSPLQPYPVSRKAGLYADQEIYDQIVNQQPPLGLKHVDTLVKLRVFTDYARSQHGWVAQLEVATKHVHDTWVRHVTHTLSEAGMLLLFVNSDQEFYLDYVGNMGDCQSRIIPLASVSHHVFGLSRLQADYFPQRKLRRAVS